MTWRSCASGSDNATATWTGARRRACTPHATQECGSSPVRLHLHGLIVEDITIQSVLRESVPLFTSFFPNLYGPADLASLRQYARAVHQSTDAYLAELSADGLSRLVDLGKLDGLGQHSVQWVTRRFVIQELEQIACEIACGADRPSGRLQLVR